MTGKSKVLIAVASLALVGGAFGGYSWWKTEQANALLVSSVPARPSLSNFPEEMRRIVATCEEVVKDGPDRADAMSTLAKLYHANGLFPEAISCYQALAAINPSDAANKHRLATVYASYGQIDAALPLWEDVSRLAPDYMPARIKHADSLLKLGKEQEARKAYEGILDDEADNPYAIVGLARIEVQNARWTSAKKLLEERLPAQHGALGNDLLGTVYKRLGLDYRQSLRNRGSGIFVEPYDPWVEEVYEHCYDPFRLNLLAGDASLRGNEAQALRRLENAARYAPDYAPVQYQLAAYYLKRQNHEAALKYLERSVQLSPELADAWIQLRQIHTMRGNVAAANQALENGLRHSPRSPSLHLERGRKLLAEGKQDEALAAFRESARLRPEEAIAFIEIAKVHMDNNRIDEAIRELEAGLRAEPGHPLALSILAMHWIIQGDRARAEQAMAGVANQARIEEPQRADLVRAFRERFGALPATR
jgi:tetratricopeptide (TPR) repeat protein